MLSFHRLNSRHTTLFGDFRFFGFSAVTEIKRTWIWLCEGDIFIQCVITASAYTCTSGHGAWLTRLCDGMCRQELLVNCHTVTGNRAANIQSQALTLKRSHACNILNRQGANPHGPEEAHTKPLEL